MALIGTHKDGCEADMEEGLFDKPEAVTVPGGEVGA